MSADRIAVTWLAGAMVDTAFTQSLTDLVIAPQSRDLIYCVWGYQSGPNLAEARHNMTSYFLDYLTGSDWLLMVDSDRVFTPEDLAALYDAADPDETPIIGATYVGLVPSIGAKTIEAARLVEGVTTYLDEVPDGVEEVDYIGTGMLLIHRSVLERMREDPVREDPAGMPWFAYDVVEGELHAEDYTFCHRARLHGYPVKIHGGVVVGHCKRVRLYPD